MRPFLLVAPALFLCACTTTDMGQSNGNTDGGSDGGSNVNAHRGFPSGAPWVSYYGTAANMGDLAKVASTFRVINIDADPTDDPASANFSKDQIAQLKNGGTNRVISYLDIGSCENTRSYWATVPAGFVSCNDNKAAQRGPYGGYPDETWMDPSNAEYQKLIVQYVARRLADRGVDGFFMDNLEIIEHPKDSTDGPCDDKCAQGGLDLVKKLRDAFPDLLIVMQNGTGDRNGTADFALHGTTSDGVSFPTLLDGISHEDIYGAAIPSEGEAQFLRWKAAGFKPGGRPFWIATEDYVGNCSNTKDAQSIYQKSRANGFSPYATDASAKQSSGVCFWGF